MKPRSDIALLPFIEQPNKGFSFILNTGRTVEHWHTRPKTAQVEMLDSMVPSAWLERNPADALTVLATLTGSLTRVLGGCFADLIGGITTLSVVFLIAIAGLFGLMTTPSLLVTTLLFMLCFAAPGAGNGGTFQLVPLRCPVTTAVAGGMIGEIGALGGSILPNLLGQSRQRTGFYAARFILYAALALSILILMRIVSKRWTTTWVGGDGRALKEEEQLVTAGDRRSCRAAPNVIELKANYPFPPLGIVSGVIW